MRTENEVKQELAQLKKEYVFMMNNGTMTTSRKTKLNERIETLIWVLQESEEQ